MGGVCDRWAMRMVDGRWAMCLVNQWEVRVLHGWSQSLGAVVGR